MPPELNSIGPYRLLEPLGQGGMGMVYRAQHRESGELAAVKTVKVPEEAMFDGLRREIQALSRLRHPGIVRIIDEGVQDGLPWYAMELLAGKPLRRYCAELAVDPALGGAPKAKSLWWTQSLPLEVEAPALSRIAKSGVVGAASAARRRPTCTDVVATGFQAPPDGRLGLVPGPCPELVRTGVVAAGFHTPSDLARTATLRLVPTAKPVATVRRLAANGALGGVLTLIRRLCAPLAFLHGEGTVHRDLKPENVLVQANGMPVLVDFGLASRFEGAVGREALEAEAVQAGTIAYMAPEQIRGDPVDARADLYALGCMLFELVTGRRPFLGAMGPAVLRGHLYQMPPRPSELVEGVPEELDGLILGLLAKDPRKRLGHADDIATVLVRLGAEDGALLGPRPRSYLYRPAFGGRRHEMEQLEQRLRGLHRSEGAMILVGGESGIGKTRLGVELGRKAAAEHVRVMLSGCLPPEQGGGGALQALRRPLQQIADRCREAGREETERLLGRRGKLLAAYEPSLASLPGQVSYPEVADLPAGAALTRLYSDLFETLSAHAESQPVLLVIDDLQWADELTLGFLEFLLRGRHLGRVPLMVLGTYRADEVRPQPAGFWSLLDHDQLTRLDLKRLDEPAVAMILGDMLALDPPPEQFASYLLRHSEGNPFFVAEYLRLAVDEELVFRDEQGRWHVTAEGAPAEGLALPRSLRELLGRRLRRLSAAARRVAQAAAVLGRDVSVPVLEAMIRQEDVSLLVEFDELLRGQVLETETDRIHFVHDKIREVLYDEIASDERPPLHRAAAEAIEALRGAEPNGHHAVLGHHWAVAGEAQRAAACYLDAARIELARSSCEDALRYGREAMRLARSSAAGLVVAEALAALAQYDEALGQAAEVAREEAAPLDDRARARLTEATVQERCGRFAECHAAAVAVLDWNLSEPLRIDALITEGRALWRLSSFEEALRSLTRALEAARALGDRHRIALSLNSVGLVRKQRGDFDEALAAFEESLRMWHELGNRSGIAMGLNNIAMVHKMRGGYAEALAADSEALRIRREIGDRWGIATSLNNLGLVHQERGADAEALAAFDQSLAIRRQIGDRGGVSMSLGNIAISHKHRGAYDQALAAFTESLGIARELGNVWEIAAALTNLGGLLQERGAQTDTYAGMLEEALALWRKIGSRDGVAVCLTNLGGMHVARGAFGEALCALDEALALWREMRSPVGIANTLTSLAVARHARGEPAEALCALDEALGIEREIGDCAVQSSTLRWLGTLQNSVGRATDAEISFAQAILMSEMHGLKPGLAAALGDRARTRIDSRPVDARRDAERALLLWQEIGSSVEEGTVISSLARIDLGTGALDEARMKLNRARSMVPLAADLSHYLQVLEDDVAIHLAAGEPEQAARTAGEARELAEHHGAVAALRGIDRLFHVIVSTDERPIAPEKLMCSGRTG